MIAEIEDSFVRRWDCEIQENSDLAPLKEAEKNEDINEIGQAIADVTENHSVEHHISSGIWMFKISWNDNVEKPQVSCYGYRCGITYEGESE